MGNLLEKYITPGDGRLATGQVTRGTKRNITEETDSDEEGEYSKLSEKKKLKKDLMSTPQYIYQTLFKQGTDSDVTIVALGKEWKLHKVYLCQSPYFASMFSGAWKEANEKVVHIKIIDPHISINSLYTVFGSLYTNELSLEPDQLVSVMATAALFQLDVVCEKCTEAMIENLGVEVVLSYHNAALEYGVSSLKEATFNWLLVNLLTLIRNKPDILSLISVELMASLVSSPNLFVVHTESSIYFLLQTWLYYILKPSQKRISDRHQILSQSSEYFHSLYDGTEYLLTEEGKKFAPPFKALRIHQLINLVDDLNRIINDHIIPLQWLHEAMTGAWISLLKVDHGLDRGPKNCTEEDLTSRGIRCGRILMNEDETKWRWTGFCNGLDLVWMFKNRCIKVRRNHRNNDVGSMLSVAKRRYIACRLTVIKLDDQRKVVHSEKSEIRFLKLVRNEEVIIKINSPPQSLFVLESFEYKKLCVELTLSKLYLNSMVDNFSKLFLNSLKHGGTKNVPSLSRLCGTAVFVFSPTVL